MALSPEPKVILFTTRLVPLPIVGCFPDKEFAKPLTLLCDNGASTVMLGCFALSWSCILLVGSKNANVAAVMLLADILPLLSLKSTRLLVRFAEVTVVAAPVISSSLSSPKSVSCV